MKIGVFTFLTLIVFSFGVCGCAAVQKEHKVETAGAGTGAAEGTLAEHKTEPAIKDGGLTRGLLEVNIGHYSYDARRTRQETAQKYGTPVGRGTMIRIEGSSAEPAMFKPGEKTELTVTYAVLGASANQEFNITETREIRLGDQLIGKPVVNVVRKAGTYTSRIPLLMPSNAGPGTYKVLTTIQTVNAQASSETTFMVR